LSNATANPSRISGSSSTIIRLGSVGKAFIQFSGRYLLDTEHNGKCTQAQ
jgi:hypothetical protein